MSSISILKRDITQLDTDAVVNAANSGLQAGGGVCGAVFKAAGYHRLQAACDRIGHCEVGSAVITPGFDLKARYIIHAVGPVWVDGQHNEDKLLAGVYTKSLELAMENNCSSIGFPLISAGIFGYPVEEAWSCALNACSSFLHEHPEIDLKIIFAVLSQEILLTGQEILKREAPEYTSLPEAKDDCLTAEALKTKHVIRDKLSISGQQVDAVFFHRPEEPDGYLSNWYPSPITVEGIRFSSVEQYIMYKKCEIFGDAQSANQVLATADTKMQQSIGRDADGYISQVWAGMRQIVALRGLFAKFSQNEDLKQKLLETGNAFLVECARTDKVWACGRRLDDDRRFDAAKWDGQNILGFALMEVRSMLRQHNSEIR